MHKHITGAATAAATLLALAAPGAAEARAQDNVITESMNVSYGDLNLDNERDARRMLQRVSRASRAVCGGRPDPRNFTEMRAFRACAAEAADSAVAAINHPVLTAEHIERGGRAPGALALADTDQ